MKNVLITGPCGYLGTRLLENIHKLKKYNVYSLVENIDSFSNPLCKPDIVIHLASKMPSYKGQLFDINFNATKKIASLCDENTHFIFISSDYVFKGNTHKAYSETNACDPETEYGKSKLHCERFLVENLSKVSILRTSMLYGYYNQNRNNFIQFLLSSLRNNREVELYTDVFCHPTHVDDLCEFIFYILEAERYGVFHSCSDDYKDRFELAKMFCLANDFDTSLLVPTKKPPETRWPLSLNLKPSKEFLKLAKISLENGLKYNIEENKDER